MRGIAQESGGLAFFPRSSVELASAFDRIQNELHSQYQLAYTPSKLSRDGSWREVEITIDGAPHLVARTRHGYYAERDESHRE